jgi:hypothetical protein
MVVCTHLYSVVADRLFHLAIIITSLFLLPSTLVEIDSQLISYPLHPDILL